MSRGFSAILSQPRSVRLISVLGLIRGQQKLGSPVGPHCVGPKHAKYERSGRTPDPERSSSMTRRALILSVCVSAVLVGGLRGLAVADKPRTINADLVFDDAASNKVRSDGFVTTACQDSSHPSRYCAALNSPIGPECSRISYSTLDGNYSFRTLTSADCTPQVDSTVGQRRAVLDFNAPSSGFPTQCQWSKTENGELKTLDVCSPDQMIDDVRIEAEHLFAVANGGSSTVTIYLALHSPPAANTTHFLIEYTNPLTVLVNPDGSRTVKTVSNTDLAYLYDITFNKTRTKVTKTLIAAYHLPLTATAKAIQ